ncbi:MAG: zinc ribbon domain-containing protein [Bacteroidaceae bacterium]|nr:zinc ribbon domain-containing protein [Bacteroidaceae bacterium]
MDYDKYFSDLQKQQEKMFEMERRLMEEQMQQSMLMQQFEQQKLMQMQQSMLMQAQHQMQSDADSTENSSNSDSRFCPECGEQLSMKARFCPICGTRILDDDDMKSNSEEEKFSSSEDLPECPVDWENFEGCGFTYTYESDGEDREVEVTYELGEDADGEEMYCWCSEDGPIDICDDDFRGCEDINDCGVVIAKRVIHDNDGEVKMSFGKGELTFTDQPCAIVLDEELNYSADCQETVTLTLYANQGTDVMRTNFYDLDEDEFETIKQLLEDGDTEEIWDHIDEEFFCNETFDLWGDEESERLGYEITDSDGDVIDEGDISVGSENLFAYRDIKDNFAVTQEGHPQYLLVTTDSVKRSYAEYKVPANFSIGGISFVKNDNAKKGILHCEYFGDDVTCITQIRYAGQTLSCNDMGDAGTVGDLRYFLYAWDDEDECYRLVEQA